MMDSEGGSGSAPPMGGLFGGLGVGGAAQLSPYLNVDPSYLSTQAPEFIFNQDQKRGRMENSFTAIGSSVISGGVAGGLYGLYDGVRQTAASDMSSKLRRTQIMNYTLKSGTLIIYSYKIERIISIVVFQVVASPTRLAV